MKLTEYGKAIRKYRIDRSMLLKDMSVLLDLSPSYLCALESGSKEITNDFESKLFSKISFSQREMEQIQKAIDRTRNGNIKISSDNSMLDRELVGAFCRKHAKLSNEQKRSILSILEEVKTG